MRDLGRMRLMPAPCSSTDTIWGGEGGGEGGEKRERRDGPAHTRADACARHVHMPHGLVVGCACAPDTQSWGGSQPPSCQNDGVTHMVSQNNSRQASRVQGLLPSHFDHELVHGGAGHHHHVVVGLHPPLAQRQLHRLLNERLACVVKQGSVGHKREGLSRAGSGDAEEWDSQPRRLLNRQRGHAPAAGRAHRWAWVPPAWAAGPR